MKNEIQKLIRENYKGLKVKGKGDIIKLYREQLKNPKLLSEHRKIIRKKKRTRKIKENIPLGSSDQSSSRKSRSSPSEDLRDAIKMSIREAKSGSKKKMKKSKRKRKSYKKSK